MTSRVVFAGSIGRFPVGGHAWVDMQYLLGLRALGCEVTYLEDAGVGSWVYDWEAGETTRELAYPAGYVRDCLEGIGLAGRWIYRAGECAVGMSAAELVEHCAAADLLLVRGIPLDVWRPEYDRPRRRAFVDSDPGFTQIRALEAASPLCRTLERCETFFSVGQALGGAACSVPTLDREWHRIMPPVALDAWPRAGGAPSHFTAVLQWRSYEEVEFAGASYGNKDREFSKLLDLPRRTRQPFRLALTGADAAPFEAHGWEVAVGWATSLTPQAYRAFVRDSRAELGIAKHGYVALQSGWLSDRTACYLASGRPVLLQDTGFGDSLPRGEGLLTFRDLEEAIRGVDAINRDYGYHARAARRLAEERFSAAPVLRGLLERALP